MTLLSPVIVLLISAPLIMAVIYRWKPASRVFWLITGTLSALSWILITLSRPATVSDQIWGGNLLDGLSRLTFQLTWDSTGWSFGAVCTACLVTATLTSILRVSHDNPLDNQTVGWLTSLYFTGLGLISVAAGNLYTVIMAWAAYDLSRFIFLFRNTSDNKELQREATAFGFNCFSLIILMAAGWQSQNLNIQGFDDSLEVRIKTLILIGASLRLFISPLVLTYRGDRPEWQSIRIFIAFISAAGSLVLISRLAFPGIVNNFWPLMAAAGLATLVAGLLWLITNEPILSQSTWVLGLSTFAIVGALVGESTASQAWGLALLTSGGVIFYNTAHEKKAIPIIMLGLIGFSALIFTPAWQGVRIFGGTESIILKIAQGALLLGLTLYLAGYFRRGLVSFKGEWRIENWVWVLYLLGLAILPATQWIILFWGIPGLSNNLQAFPTMEESWPALFAGILGVIFGWVYNRIHVPASIENTITRFFTFGWLFFILKTILGGINSLVAFLDRLLEGEGGLLWTMLFLILLIGFLLQLGSGG